MLNAEVNQLAYESVMRSNPSRFRGPALPVEQVSWHDATEFCRRWSQREGKTFRLPTEEEWEYACRAGTTTPWSFGDDPILTSRYANFFDRSNHDIPMRPGRSDQNDGFAHTCDPYRFMCNAFGLCDMHGNVWEWCQDDYGPYPTVGSTTSSVTEQVEPTPRKLKVSRGGSWYDGPHSLRSAHRNPLDPNFSNDNLGFRIVLEDPNPSQPAH
jgi:formylglycine-generating enzyme required for sulfatase activity